MADILQKLFGSAARVRILRLFLFNPQQPFSFKEIISLTRSRRVEARKEITLLEKIGFLVSGGKRGRVYYTLNPKFEYTAALQNLILNAPVRGQEIYDKIHTTGTIKLIVTSGIFLNETEAELDLLIVGDQINDRKLRDRLRVVESDIGKELRYTHLSTEEFFYRLNMSDRLLRDVFDFPHRIVFDRLDIGLT